MIFHKITVLQEKQEQAHSTMSRKSARLLSKSRPHPESHDSEFVCNKRQKIEVNKGTSSFSGKQQFRIENKRLSISPTHAVTSSTIVPSDEMDSLACPEALPLPKPTCMGDAGSDSQDEEIVHIITPGSSPSVQPRQLFRFSNHFSKQIPSLIPLLPQMDWADPKEMWDFLNIKVNKYPRSENMLEPHPQIRSYMRPVLFTWMTEVCEMYKLHKETYNLAVEFTDRYLLFSRNVEPCWLQLFGVTALLMASKIEEIYPPKTSDFAYVCDGAFDVKTILKCEMKMIKQLEWLLSPMTPNVWVQLFLQIHALQKQKEEEEAAKDQSDLAPSPPSSPLDSPDKLTCQEHTSELYASNSLLDFASYALEEDRVQTEKMRVEMECVNISESEVKDTENVGCVGKCDSDTESCEDDNNDDDGDVMWEDEEETGDDKMNIFYPIYSTHDYLQVCRLLDSAILDKHSFKFSYKVMAASAVHLMTDIPDINLVTGLTWAQIESCVAWLKIHVDVINKHEPMPINHKSFDSIRECDSHKIQCNTISRAIWEEAAAETEKYFDSQAKLRLLMDACEEERHQCSSPPISAFITPPRSTKKSSPQ